MRFLATVLLVTFAQGQLINLVPDHMEVAYTSFGGAVKLTDGDPSTCQVYDNTKFSWGSWNARSKAWVMFAGTAVGVEYNLEKVRVYFQDFDKDVKDALVLITSKNEGEKLCGRITRNQNVNEDEGWVEVTCRRPGGSVVVRGEGYFSVCEIGVYVETLPAIPESWPVLDVTAWQNDGQSNAMAKKAINEKYAQWDKKYCAEVDGSDNNAWGAQFAEPQYVKGVVIYSLIKWNRAARNAIHGASVWVEREGGEWVQCGAPIGEGTGSVAAPVNMAWCDEVATKVRVQRAGKVNGVKLPLVLCEVEINAVAIPEEGTEAIDETSD